jgi:hypothetical protein
MVYRASLSNAELDLVRPALEIVVAQAPNTGTSSLEVAGERSRTASGVPAGSNVSPEDESPW